MRVPGIQVEDDIDVLFASGALTATTNSAQKDGYKNLDAIILVAVVTAFAGTSPTLDIKLQDSFDSGTTWQDTGIAITQIAGVTGTFGTRSVLPLAPMVRAVATIGGSLGQSMTFSLRAFGKAKKNTATS
jgi:hypothetical protein